MKSTSIIRLTAATLSLSMLSLSLAGCTVRENSDSPSDNLSESEYTHRVILVSDMHYTTEETTEELKALYPDANTSVAAGDAFGYTQREKIQCILDDINAFAERESIDAIMILGDISLDDYSYRNLPENYVQKFKEDFIDQTSYPCYTIPGNHDSYSNEDWKKVIGTDRQFSVKIGDAVFIMLDTFSQDPATGASGSPYVGVDTDFLEQELAKYPTETIFLCSHYYTADSNDYKFTKLLKDNDRIVCMFRGHTHQNTLLAPEEMDYRFLVDIGGYGYNGGAATGNDFSYFDDAWAWGYQVLEWNDTTAHIYHVKPARHYSGSNGEFDFVGGIEDDKVLTIKK